MAKTKQVQTYFSGSETAIIAAAVALVKSLNIAESELTQLDCELAVEHVCEWLYGMEQEYDDSNETAVIGQVCREFGVEQ